MAVTNTNPVSLKALTATALSLPGLLANQLHAAEDDSVDFQYSHYEEGERASISAPGLDEFALLPTYMPVPNRYKQPIQVDSLHGRGRITLTDRIKFAFNYTQDTWSGATPYGTVPEFSSANYVSRLEVGEKGIPLPVAGASPYAIPSYGTPYFNNDGKPVYRIYNPDGTISYRKDRPVHVMGYASPETRQQGDFKLSYDFGEAALDVGGGISVERDYESRFVNLGGQLDFDQKQTTVNLGLSYTNSDINSVFNPSGAHFYAWSGQHQDQITHDAKTGLLNIKGNRQDWAIHLDLTQVINKNALLNLGLTYTRSVGFMENPYKLSWVFKEQASQDPNLPSGIKAFSGQAFVEQRPNERNQFNWTARWVQLTEPLDAAMHLNYSFAHDDWGINAHTFEADWVQPLVAGWTITPRIRYYSQSAADFYGAYFFSNGEIPNYNTHGMTPGGNQIKPPENFSSDQRLSGYGTLSGGLTVSKQFAKGIGIETGFEYYTHQGGLKLGGGEQSFADFDYWVVNAALKVNLSAVGQSLVNNTHHNHPHSHPALPAGIMFGHSLNKAGDFMVGYRYQRTMQGGGFLYGTRAVADDTVVDNACPARDILPNNSGERGCTMFPDDMTTNMHMVELMYAPTNWLTLMLMPQFMDMNMSMYTPASQLQEGTLSHNHGSNNQQTGGIGDTGIYALVNLFDNSHHHIHTSLGFSAPTGDSSLRPGETVYGGYYAHYSMQLGSGTWDFKPSLTYTGKSDSWSCGAQVGGTKRLESSNSSGYALGDMFESSLWGGYDLTHWLSATLRVAYNWQGTIKGQYALDTKRIVDQNKQGRCWKFNYTTFNQYDAFGRPLDKGVFDEAAYQACLAGASEKTIIDNYNAFGKGSPMDNPANYGGHYVDVGFGLSATVTTGEFAGNRLAFEWLQPVYTNVNGYQLDRDGALSFTWSYGF